MKFETRKVDHEKKIMQITTSDERWYEVDGKFVPSVTWILHRGYPKGIGLLKWYADKGMSEAEAVKKAAADKGSKVHSAITDLLRGQEVKIDSKYMNNDLGIAEELTADEYGCAMSFLDWLNETNPEVIATDYTVVNHDHNYAGTVDMKLKINGELYIVDVKTSQDIWPEFELQVSAYKHAEVLDVVKVAILQVGYRRNKTKKFKFTEVEDQFPLFLNVKGIWEKECAGVVPLQKDYPLSLKWGKGKKVESD